MDELRKLVSKWRGELIEVPAPPHDAYANSYNGALRACAAELEAALAAIPAGGWTTGDEVLWTDSSGMYAPEVGTVHARNPDGTYWIDFADGSVTSSATASELSPPLAASRAQQEPQP